MSLWEWTLAGAVLLAFPAALLSMWSICQASKLADEAQHVATAFGCRCEICVRVLG